MVINGPIEVFVPEKGKAQFEAKLAADGTAVSYGDQFMASRLRFDGILTHAGLKGAVAASGQGFSGTYVGSLSWGKELALGGSLVGTIDSISAAPKIARSFLPKGSDFRGGRIQAWVAYSGKGAIALDGTVDANVATYGKEALASPRLGVSAGQNQVALNLLSGTWNGWPVRAALNYDAKSRMLDGLVRANSVALSALAKRVGLKNIEGTGNVVALITGSSASPLVSVRADGYAQTMTGGRRFNLGHIVAAADFENNILHLTRVSIHGPQGIATAEGIWNQKTNALNVDVIGSSIPLSVLTADIKGDASFLGKVSGTPQAPNATGKLEVYGAEYEDQQIPLVLADVRANKSQLTADNVIAVKNATKATGSFVLNFADGSIFGKAAADGIQLSDILGPRVAGTLNIDNATVGGNLKHISVQGSFTGNNIVAEAVRVNTVTGLVTLNGQQAGVSQVLAQFDEGNVKGSADYDLHSKTGGFQGKANGLSLRELTAGLPEDTTLTGNLSSDFQGAIDAAGLKDGKASGQLSNVALNDVPVGGGPFAIQGAGDQWTGSATVGDLERYLDIQNFALNSKTKQAQADVNAYNLELASLFAIARPYLASSLDPSQVRDKALAVLPDPVLTQLQSLGGTVSAAVTLNGPVANPNLTIPSLQASNLTVGGSPSGTIDIQAKRQNEVWDISSLNWTGGPGILTASGTVAEHGATDLSGDLNNLNAAWLAFFDPSLSRFTGQSDLSFKVSGPTKSPDIETSFDYREGGRNPLDRREINVLASIRDGEISSQGTYYYNGFTGPLTASIPFNYPFDFPKDREVAATLSLPARPIQSLNYLIPWMDPKRTAGTIAGNLNVTGPIDKLKVTGLGTLSATSFAATDIDTLLRNLTATANFDGNALSLNASAAGSQGGTVGIQDARVELGNISDVFSQSLDTLLSHNVSGSLSVRDFKVVQKGQTPINATFASNITASGPLRAPSLKGRMQITEGSVTAPSAPGSSVENFQPTVNPHFDIALSMPNPVTLNAGLGNFLLTGDGTLGGSLALPNLDAEMLVEKGAIRLPNARVSIDPGGTIHLIYQATPYGAPNARADLDLTGTTAVTANPYGDLIQRYDVTLQIRGDLLSDQGLQLSAQSDPPDLSSDQVLTLLGQGGAFLTQAGSPVPFRADQQLQAAFYTALPLLFNPFTSQLASGLGLDYLDIEYNSFEGVSVTGAKALGKNLILSARRELSQPLVPGLKPAWDIRLSYRLPFKGKNLRNLSFMVGADQDRPWIIGVQYGFRF